MSQSESQTKDTKESLSGHFLSANTTLVAWLIFLGFGSAVLARYYSHIHYFPEVKWEDSFTYLAAVTVLGSCIVVLYALLLYIPGWLWSEFLIYSELRQGALCNPIPDEEKHEPCFRGVGIHLVLPFAVLMVAIHFAMYTNCLSLAMVISIVGLAGLVYYSCCDFLYELRPLTPQVPQSSLLLKYTAISFVAALASIVSAFILRHALDPKGHSWQMPLFCTIAVVISNLLVAVQFRGKPTRAVITGILAAITLLICGELFPVDGQTPSGELLKSFGIGDEGLEVNLYITVPGRKLLADSNVAVADKVTLKSRLGEEYLVEWYEDRKGGGQIERRAALPKNMVDYWTSSREPKPKSDENKNLTRGQKVAGLASGLLVVLLFALHFLIQRLRNSVRWAAFQARVLGPLESGGLSKEQKEGEPHGEVKT